jgi:hypothetical protein
VGQRVRLELADAPAADGGTPRITLVTLQTF